MGSPYKIESLNSLILEALVITEAKSKRHDCPVTIEATEGLKIICDEVEIEQVIINLINNAIDAVKDIQGRWVKINSFVDREEIVLQVIDAGGGISVDIEKKLFQPFFTTKKVGEGTGLGLSISKGILDNHKATFGLNRSFKNTCFEIRFAMV